MNKDDLCYWKWTKIHKQFSEQRVDYIVCGVYSGEYECNGFKKKCSYYRPVNNKDKIQAGKDRIKAKIKKASGYY